MCWTGIQVMKRCGASSGCKWSIRDLEFWAASGEWAPRSLEPLEGLLAWRDDPPQTHPKLFLPFNDALPFEPARHRIRMKDTLTITSKINIKTDSCSCPIHPITISFSSVFHLKTSISTLPLPQKAIGLTRLVPALLSPSHDSTRKSLPLQKVATKRIHKNLEKVTSPSDLFAFFLFSQLQHTHKSRLVKSTVARHGRRTGCQRPEAATDNTRLLQSRFPQFDRRWLCDSHHRHFTTTATTPATKRRPDEKL